MLVSGKSPAPGHLLVLLVLPLLLAVHTAGAVSWDLERLQWLVVTKPGATNVQLNCTSDHIYPFTLLNDSSLIGAIGSRVRRVWWVLPDARLINASYEDDYLRSVDRGVGLLVKQVGGAYEGLYHCAVEADTQVNETEIDQGSTTVYYYKRGLNLYGPDLYGDNTWEKYKRNTLIGSLTAGLFLAAIAGYALLGRLGVLDKCRGGGGINAVASLDNDTSNGSGPTSAAEKAAPEATELESAPPPASAQHSRASIRSRRSEKAAYPTAAAETAA